MLLQQPYNIQLAKCMIYQYTLQTLHHKEKEKIKCSLVLSCVQMSSTEEGQRSLAAAEAKLGAKTQRRNVVLATVLTLCVGAVLVASAVLVGTSLRHSETLSNHADVDLDTRVRHLVALC